MLPAAPPLHIPGVSYMFNVPAKWNDNPSFYAMHLVAKRGGVVSTAEGESIDLTCGTVRFNANAASHAPLPLMRLLVVL